MNEKKLVAGSYIVNFFQDIQNLNHTYAQYVNLLTELKAKHGENSEDSKPEEAELNTLTETSQTVRYYVHKTYISYKSILKSANIKEDPDIETSNTSMKSVTSFIIRVEDIEKFVIGMNGILLNDVIKDLLTTSQEIYSQIYDNDTPKPTN